MVAVVVVEGLIRSDDWRDLSVGQMGEYRCWIAGKMIG